MESLKSLSSPRQVLGRVLYGTLFVVVLPVALVFWARGSADVIRVPVFPEPPYGLALAALGVMVMPMGVVALWRRGGGLPMNAFPPPRLVASGIYGIVPHPIYCGFVVACAGCAIFTRSSSGLWLVTPAVALACSALVLGYEMPDMRRRFGEPAQSLWMPADRDEPPSGVERARVYITIVLPWFVAFEMISYLSESAGSIDTHLGFEGAWPVLAWTEPIYFSAYLAVLGFPLLTQSSGTLRRFVSMGYIAMLLVFPLFLFLPLYANPRPFSATSIVGYWLQMERSPSSGAAALPSFHVVWACIVAVAISESGGWKKTVAWIWALLVAASCVTTGMHSIADVLAGIAAFILIRNMPGLWRWLLQTAEFIANSWREWRVGPVRIINHGAYAGAATFAGMFMIDTLLGKGRTEVTFLICIGALVGAALWAQWVEGSSVLLRPLGFYGGMLGSMAGATMALALHFSLWSTFASICVAAPWIQALGRLRCLVQGCCHGAAAGKTIGGIRYFHPRSRVSRLTHLEGVPVHATPLYSILWNVVVGMSLLRLVQLHSTAAFVCGVYLLLSGFGRFVEEAYRGEPQTRVMAGLRFYQWIAIVCVVAGAALTCQLHSLPLSISSPRWSSLGVALVCGVIAWFVSGVDFPESSRRFARLT